MDPEELEEFQLLFRSVDISDPIQLRKWFEDYPELMFQEHCLIIGKSEATVTRYKHKACVNPVYVVELSDGCHVSRPRSPTAKPKMRKIDLVPPEDWDSREWLEEQYVKNKIGAPTLAKAIGCSKYRVQMALAKAGIIQRKLGAALATDNPCCDRAWITEHYIDNKMTLRGCAELAGVGHSTFRQWMTKFGMTTRSIYDANLKSGGD
jgi:hypothetical protein